MILAERLININESPSLSISEHAAALIKQGRDIIDLSIGEPDFPTPEKIKFEGINAIKQNRTHYTSSAGILELREAISRKLNTENKIETDAAHILVTPGAKSALYYLNCALINPGDEVIIPQPCWFTYVDSVKICGGIPITIGCGEENNFKPTVSEIERHITKKTKYIIINSPCNPTGAIWSSEELEQLTQIVKKYDIFLVSDEIYEHIAFEEFTSAASIDSGNRTITIHGFSKGPAMTGWRLGFIVAPLELIQAMKKIQQLIATCAPSISQYAGVVAFEQRQSIKKMREEYEERRNILVNGLNRIKGIRCTTPQGAFYVFANITQLKKSSLQVAESLLSAGVTAVPGKAYGDDNYMRFSFAASRDKIQMAIERMVKLWGEK